MDLRVEQDRVDQFNSFGVRERRPKSGNLSSASSWTVEIRSNLFKLAGKIWVGSFKTREEANRACDAALHYLRRPTHYYTYPPLGYFREIGELPQDKGKLKSLVKSLAKEYANWPLPIITVAPTIVASKDLAPELDHLALQNFRVDPTVRNVSEVENAHNSAHNSPRVPASSPSSSSSRMELLAEFLMTEEPDDPSLMAGNEFKQVYSGCLACCETPALEVAKGSSDVAINSANKEAAKDFIDSIDSPLASVPRLQGHSRRHSLEFAKIEGTDKPDQLEHTVMCKSTAD